MSIHLDQANSYPVQKTHLKQGGFTFKRFFVGHDKSPMKITTDSVLLGAWAPIMPVPKNVLDIGTGCGVIALMLAQRLQPFTESVIEAIDIDFAAVNQCRENIAHSPFVNISAKQQDIKSVLLADSQSPNDKQYDLIVCNPPYFVSSVACRNEQRQTARYTEQLSHADLFACVKQLLTENGRFCVVLPFHLADEFTLLGKQYQLFLSERVDVRYTEDKDFSLVLCGFSKHENNELTTKEQTKKELCMRHLDKSYTEPFANLLKDFYLRF